MVEKLRCKEVVGHRHYYGDYHSRKGLCEMALNGLKKREVIDMFLSNGKDLSSAREIKKATLLWRSFMLLLLGACGVYICLVGVDHRLVPRELSFGPSHQGLPPGVCPKSSERSRANIPEHHPQPITYDRGECACTPVHYFVILSMQRSGSGWFETLLNDHPNVSSHGEVFTVKERRNNFTDIEQTLDAVYNLDWNSSAVKSECTSAVGHKWMLNQGLMEYNREVAAYYKKRGVSVIFLARRNLLKRLVSVLANAYDRQMKPLNGTHKSHVHLQQEAMVLAEYKPTLNVKHLLGNLQRVQEISDDAIRFFNGTRMALVYYEDLVKDPKESIIKIQEFLGVPSRDLASRQVKIHTKPVQEQIDNWEEVFKGLKGTEYESYLEDTDYS